MKNFLKSTALFACIAMMFCACTDDATDDATGGGSDEVVAVSAPSVTEVTPGKSNIFVEWQVLKGSVADQTLLTWVNTSNSAIYGSRTENVDGSKADKTYYAQILTVMMPETDDDGVESGEEIEVTIVAGEYLVTLTNLCTTTEEESESVSYTVTVYDDSTYADFCPEPTNITYDVDMSEATITWGDIHEDCISILITYNTDVELEITGDELVSGTQTVLSGAEAAGEYSYVATFCPEGSEDAIYVSGAEDLTLGTNPGAPSWVSAKGGDGRILARWMYSEEDLEDLDSSIITYTSTADDSASKSVSIAKADLVYNADEYEYQYYISSVDAGEYSVSVTNVKIGGFYSDATSATATINVYNEDSFTVPTFSKISIDDNGDVTISWSVDNGEYLKSIEVQYTDNNGEVQTVESVISGDYITSTVLPNAKLGSAVVSATAYMRYNNGIDLIEYKLDVSSVVIPVDELPEISTVAIKYDTTDGSQIYVAWDDLSATNYIGLKVYWGLADASYPSGYSSETLALAETSYTAKNLEVADYKVYVVATTGDEEYACLTPAEVTTYGVSTYEGVIMPVPTITSENDLVTVEWSAEGVSEDLYSVTYSYADGDADDVVIMAAEIATATTFAYSYGVTTELTYTVQFQPADGNGAVSVTPEDSPVAIPEQTPDAPTALTVGEYGYNDDGMFVNLSWTAPAGVDDVAKYYLYYSTDGKFPEGDGIEISGATTTSYMWEPENVGEYSLFLKSSTAAGTLSDNYAAVDALAYNATYFTVEDLPTATVVYNNAKVTVTWSNVNKYITSVDVVYGSDTTNDNITITDGSTTVFNYDADSEAKITFSAIFQPSVGSVEVTGGETTFVIPSADIVLNGSTYEIYSGLGLAAFADIVNGTTTYSSQATTENFSYNSLTVSGVSTSATLMASVDLSDVCSATAGNWSPIGGDGYNYTGTFDGGGNTINGLYINGATTAYQGLFGYTNAATIKNVKLNNPYLVSEAGSLGAFIGRMNGVGYLTDCYITGTSGVITGLSYIGGCVGLFSNGYITSCHNEGATVTATINSSTTTSTGVNAYARVGGIVGSVACATEIIGCSNAGSVRFESHAAAGIAGYITAAVSIVACSNTGDVVVADGATVGSYAGGIAGYDSSTASVVGCCNSGSIEVAVVSSLSAGIVGRFGEKTLIKGNYNIGSVSTTSTASKYNYTIGYIAGGSSSTTRATDADGNDVYGTYNQYNYFVDVDGDTAVYGDGATLGGNYTPVYNESTIYGVSSIAGLDDYIDNMNISLAEVSSDYRYKSSGSATAGPVLYNTAE